MLSRIGIHNFRSIESLQMEGIPPIAVFFGPNGAGKSSVMDAIWLLRNCMTLGTTSAIDKMHLRHGAFHLKSGKPSVSAFSQLQIMVGIDTYDYLVSFPNTPSGLTDPPGEYLVASNSKNDDEFELKCEPGDSVFEIWDADNPFFPEHVNATIGFGKRFQLATSQLISAGRSVAWADLYFSIFHSQFFRSLNFDIRTIKNSLIERTDSLDLASDGSNLWSVLKNLHDCRDTEDLTWSPASRYETILKFIKKAFPEFRGWELVNPPGTPQVYSTAGMDGVGRVYSQHLPDGLIQFTILMTAIFSRPGTRGLVMFDEPDLSLHPWAQFVLAEAITEATSRWNRQILLATHSPVLLSQFPEDCLFAVQLKNHSTAIQRVSEMTENRDLLDQYTAGALYMSQLIGEQSSEPMVSVVPIDE